MDVEGPSQAALEKQTRVLGKHAMHIMSLMSNMVVFSIQSWLNKKHVTFLLMEETSASGWYC